MSIRCVDFVWVRFQPWSLGPKLLFSWSPPMPRATLQEQEDDQMWWKELTAPAPWTSAFNAVDDWGVKQWKAALCNLQKTMLEGHVVLRFPEYLGSFFPFQTVLIETRRVQWFWEIWRLQTQQLFKYMLMHPKAKHQSTCESKGWEQNRTSLALST